MPQVKSKTGLIIAAILGTLVVTAGVLVPMYFFVWKTDYPTWDLKFFGGTVDQSVNVTYKEIQKEITSSNYSFNHTKWWTPDGYESEIRNYTGISLWDLIKFSGVDYGRANALRFVAEDGWASPELSLEVVENNKSLIIIYNIEEGEILLGPEDEGNGYLRSAVNYSINEAKKSSHFNMKWLTGIEFVIDWDLTLYGGIVDEELPISYNDILTNPNLTRYENVAVNYTKYESELVTVSAVSLWSIIEEIDLNYTTANMINFTSDFSDFESKESVPLDWVENNESMVLIVYAIDGELLDPDEDGYLLSLVDYTLTIGTYSSKYKVRYLDGIKFFEI